MQLAGPGVFGPPKDREGALAVLREAVASGVDHIDTSDFYGPHITNQLIREALHPYPDELVIVTKISARRGAGRVLAAGISRDELTQAVHDNLRNLGLDILEVVNLRSMHGIHAPAEGSIEEPLTVLAELQQRGPRASYRAQQCHVCTDHRGAPNSAASCACRTSTTWSKRADDTLIDDLAREQIAYVPFFPLGGFTPLQSTELAEVAAARGGNAHAGGSRLVVAACAQYPVDSRDIVRCTSAREPRGSGPETAG